MSGPAVDVISRFGAVEDDQRYTRLVELFADDAVYYDPFFGPQRGKDAIADFMGEMEKFVPGSGARFDSWESVGDVDCGWAKWLMVAPNAAGEEVPVPGQSLYRLRDGLVTRVVDYLDPQAYQRLRGDEARTPDLAGAAGALRDESAGGGAALDLVHRFWEIQESKRYTDLAELFTDDAVFADVVAGTFEGKEAVTGFLAEAERKLAGTESHFELVDAAGDDTVAWSQWIYKLPGGDVPGWTLHRVRDGRFTLDEDYFDTVLAATLPRD
ncbi:MAG: nuclear transport factor 2 family protein [Actinomycetota bacterium]